MRTKVLIFISVLLFFCLISAGIAQDQNIAGTWKIHITFISGETMHTAIINQKDNELSGTYKGNYKEGTISGDVKGNDVTFRTRLRHEATNVSFKFVGTVQGNTMKGTVDMGEYWTADWTAEKSK